MKQNQKILLVIGLGVVILLNILLLGRLLTDFFSGSNRLEETVAATDSGAETTGEETTATDETSTEEVTTEEPTTEEPTTEEVTVAWVEREIPYDEVRTLLRKFSWGDGDGQLGFWENPSPSGANNYPEAFAVENGIIYVADQVNNRIVVCDGGQYSHVAFFDGTSKVLGSGMLSQSGWLGLLHQVGNERKIGLYSKDNNRRMLLNTPASIANAGTIEDILEIGDTYIVCKVYMKLSKRYEAYRYDWVEDIAESIGKIEEPSISMSDSFPVIIGEADGKIYYYQSEYSDGKAKYTINCEMADSRLYTVMHDIPLKRSGGAEFYLSANSGFYIMERYEDRIEISEISLS